MKKINVFLAAILFGAASASFANGNSNNGVNTTTLSGKYANFNTYSNSTVLGGTIARGGCSECGNGSAYTIQGTKSVVQSKYTPDGFKTVTTNVGEGYSEALGPAASVGGFVSNVGSFNNANLFDIKLTNKPGVGPQ